MKSGPVLTVSVFIYIVVSSVASAQVVDIPDADLRTAIADALNIVCDTPAMLLKKSRIIGAAAH